MVDVFAGRLSGPVSRTDRCRNKGVARICLFVCSLKVGGCHEKTACLWWFGFAGTQLRGILRCRGNRLPKLNKTKPNEYIDGVFEGIEEVLDGVFLDFA